MELSPGEEIKTSDNRCIQADVWNKRLQGVRGGKPHRRELRRTNRCMARGLQGETP